MLYLARDRVGEKPLYYGFIGKTFAFASDLNSLTCLDNFNKPVNTGILETYFRYGYIPAPYSVYEDIYKLEPGKILEIRAPFAQCSFRTYWSMRQAAYDGQNHLFRGSEEEAAAELEEGTDKVGGYLGGIGKRFSEHLSEHRYHLPGILRCNIKFRMFRSEMLRDLCGNFRGGL